MIVVIVIVLWLSFSSFLCLLIRGSCNDFDDDEEQIAFLREYRTFHFDMKILKEALNESIRRMKEV